MNWLDYYQDKWSSELILSNDKSLQYEIKKLKESISTEGVTDTLTLASKGKMRETLYGQISNKETPFDFQIEVIRSNLNIDPYEWEGYSPELKGKILATEILKSDLETLHRYYAELASNKKKEQEKLNDGGKRKGK